MKWSSWLWSALCMVLPVAAAVGGDHPAPMQINGRLYIDERGDVTDFRPIEALPDRVEGAIQRSVRQWKFEPILREGRPVSAQTGLWLTVAAVPVAEDAYRLRIDKIRFLDQRTLIDTSPPRYPKAAQRASVSASVLLAIRLDAAGHVVAAYALQTAVSGFGAAGKADGWRSEFAESATEAALRWRFSPSDDASGDSTMLMPIEYRIDGVAAPRLGVAAGSVSAIPWLSDDGRTYDADGLQSGNLLAVDSAWRLKTAVLGETLR